MSLSKIRNVNMTNLAEYIEEHSSEESLWLQQIAHKTNTLLLNPHMLSGRVQGRLLSLLSHMIRPQRVLELGTFTGYSALCLAEGLAEGGYVDTIEKNDELEEMIKSNFSMSPYADRIHLHIGDALQVIEQLRQHRTVEKQYDLMFVDADKREYAAYYEALKPLLRKGGYLLADNTLWDGHVIDKEYDKDKQTLGLRHFNDMVAADKEVEKVIVPLRDGLTIIRKL